MALLPKPPHIPGDPSDKIQHILAFTVLAGLATAAYPRAPLLRIALLLSGFGALIELLQLIPPLHRDGNVVDWLADSAAVALVLAAVAAVRWRRARGRF
jgi:VanZ family protein